MSTLSKTFSSSNCSHRMRALDACGEFLKSPVGHPLRRLPTRYSFIGVSSIVSRLPFQGNRTRPRRPPITEDGRCHGFAVDVALTSRVCGIPRDGAVPVLRLSVTAFGSRGRWTDGVLDIGGRDGYLCGMAMNSAECSPIDKAAAVWSIPNMCMQANKEHGILLPSPAMAIPARVKKTHHSAL